MKIYDAYRMGIEAGMKRDLRPQSEVQKILSDAKALYDSLPDDRKELFDMERLWNPYADSRFSVLAEEAKELDAVRLMWGIDISPAEIMLADRLREKGEMIDAVVAHHPNGTSKTCFPEVMMQMTAMFENMGVPKEKAYQLVKDRMDEVLRGMQGYNYNQKGVFLTEGTVINPMWNAFIRTKDYSDYTQVNNNFYAEYRFTDAFKMIGRLGVMLQGNNSEIFHPASHTDFVDYTSEEMMKRRGRYTYNDGSAHRITADVSANYSRTFAEKHLLFLNLGWSMEDYETNSARFVAEGFPNDQLSDIGYARSYLKDGKPTTFENKTRDAGAIGALNYSYDNRYLFDASFRLSGSSQFGSKNRWGKFWSLGLGWNVHKEKFMQNATWLNQLKIRGSVGFTGSQNFNSYQSMSTWNYYSSSFYNGRPSSYLLSMANENLKWQRKYDQNVGFDFTAFNHRLNMRFDYYIATTDDLLTDVTIPSSTGFTSYKENLGKVQNKGAELYASYRVYQSANRRDYVNLYANVTHNSNKIKEISNSLRTYNDQQTNAVNNRPITRYEEGQSMTAIWAVPSLGIDPTTGNDILVKKDGTTTFAWNSDDLAIVGDTESDIYGNCGISAYFKGFTFALGMNYQFGGQLYNQTLVDKVENADLTKNVDRRVFSDRWTNPGDISQFKNIKDQSTTRSTSRFVEDNNVWAFSTLNISYDFDHIKAIKQLGFNRLRLAFDMSDIARISSMKTERGTSYPYAKSFSFSLQAMF